MVRNIDPETTPAVYSAQLLTVSGVLMYVTTRQKHHGTGSLTSSLPQAKQVAEPWRAPRALFCIYEIPVVLLGTCIGPVACAHFHREQPFGGWLGVDTTADFVIGTPARQAIGSLSEHGGWRQPHPSERAFVRGKASWITGSTNDPVVFDQLPPSFHDRISVQRGGSGVPLGWRRADVHRSVAGVQRVVEAFEAANDIGAVVRAREKYARCRVQFASEWTRMQEIAATYGTMPAGTHRASQQAAFFRDYRNFCRTWVPGT